MAGFGRTGEWFAVNHWNVVPGSDDDGEGTDERVRAARRRRHAARASPITSSDKVFYGGLTYNSHPLGCAAALATIAVYEEDDLIGAREGDGRGHEAAHARIWKRGTRSSARRDRSASSASSSS